MAVWRKEVFAEKSIGGEPGERADGQRKRIERNEPVRPPSGTGKGCRQHSGERQGEDKARSAKSAVVDEIKPGQGRDQSVPVVLEQRMDYGVRRDDGTGQVEKDATQNDRPIEQAGPPADASVFYGGGQRQYRSQQYEGLVEPYRKKR